MPYAGLGGWFSGFLGKDEEAEWQAAKASWCGKVEAETHRQLREVQRKNPDRAGSLHIRLGDLARMQGKRQAAKDAYQQAMDLAQARLKRIKSDVADPIRGLVNARYAMGCLYRSLGNYTQAETQFREAKDDGVSQLLNQDDPVLARTAGALASVMSTRGDLDQARKLCTWAANHVTAVCGTNDAEIAWIDDMMGRAYVFVGRHADALPVYEHMLKIRKAVLLPQDPDLADAHNRLASIQFELGHRDIAIKHLQQALEIRTQAFGPKHPHTLRSRKNMEEVRTAELPF